MAIFSAREQYFLELVNRARLNPGAEAVRFGISLNDELAAGTISTAAKQVLAPNALLHDAAVGHSQHMIDVDQFKHSGIGDGDLGSRMADAGYEFWTAGENIALTSWDSIDIHHENLFKSAGHRENILGTNFQEVGIGSVNGTYDGWAGSLMTTQNFGAPFEGVFVTGVSYADTVSNNDFYTVGEGRGAQTVQLFKNGALEASNPTWSSGGYALSTTESGTMEIVFSGGGLSGEKGATFYLGATNVKIDMIDSSTIGSNVSITLTRGAAHANLLGMWGVSATGNGYANTLSGNTGGNTMNGLDGNDSLWGRSGNDTLYGSNGDDVLVGGAGADRLSGGAGADSYKYYGSTEGGDTFTYFSSNDLLVFEGSAFGLGSFSGQLQSTAFTTGNDTTAVRTTERFIYNQSDDTLWFDSNGSTTGGTRVMIADLANDYALAVADIWIV